LGIDYIVGFLQYQTEKGDRKKITGATMRNFVKAIKLFCEMSDIPDFMEKDQSWISKTLRYADDRIRTLDSRYQKEI
jgi:hypothetical protein